MTDLEAKVPDGTTDIWIAAPDLANVGDSRSPSRNLSATSSGKTPGAA